MSYAKVMDRIDRAIDCSERGKHHLARAHLNIALDLLNGIEKRHTDSILDAYEQTSATAHLGEIQA